MYLYQKCRYRKEKNQMRISLHMAKTFEKRQHPFVIKTNSSQTRKKRELPAPVKGCRQPAAIILLDGKMLKAVPLKSEARQGFLLSPLLVGVVLALTNAV